LKDEKYCGGGTEFAAQEWQLSSHRQLSSNSPLSSNIRLYSNRRLSSNIRLSSHRLIYSHRRLSLNGRLLAHNLMYTQLHSSCLQTAIFTLAASFAQAFHTKRNYPSVLSKESKNQILYVNTAIKCKAVVSSLREFPNTVTALPAK
jgi:hypothetical protein